MTIKPWRAMLSLFSALALLGLAACGDDDDGGDTTDTGDVVDNGTTDPDDETPDANGDAAPAPDGDFCEQVADADQYFQPPADDTEYSEYLAVLGAIEPPAEIADDWAAMLGAIEVFADVDFNDPDAAEAAFEDPAFQASMEADANITEFVREECDIDLDAG